MVETALLAALLLVPAPPDSATALDPTAFGISLDVPPTRSFREAIEQLPVPTSAAVALPPRSGREMLDMGLGMFSLSAGSVALAVTMACISDRTCEEVNPLMRKVIGTSRTAGILTKAGVGAGLHYGVWRVLPPGKKRTALLAFMAIANGLDAFHDIRVLQQIDRKGR